MFKQQSKVIMSMKSASGIEDRPKPQVVTDGAIAL
jgi:hypothetical protein